MKKNRLVTADVMNTLKTTALDQGGQIAYEQILEAFPRPLSEKELAFVMRQLEENHIDILDTDTDLEVDLILEEESEEESPAPDHQDRLAAERAAAEDGIRQYLKEIAAFPLLSPTGEYELALRAKGGDPEARNEMANRNLRLVVNIAKNYLHRGLPLEDLIQQGNLGLLTAIDRFEPEKGNRFSTYATFWIRQSITRHLYENGKMIRIPVHMNERILQYKKICRHFLEENYRSPAPEEVMREYAEYSFHRRHKEEATPKVIDKLMARKSFQNEFRLVCEGTHVTSLNQTVGEDEEDMLQDLIPDEHADDPYTYTEQNCLSANLITALRSIPEREANVIRHRIIDQWTLDECGREMNITRERVRQLQESGLRRIRNNPVISASLRSFWDAC